MTIPATVEDALAVEYFAGGVWHQLDGRADFGALMRTRRFAAPAGQPVTIEKLRVVKKAGHDFGANTAAIESIALWEEAADLQNARLWPHTFDTGDQQYMLAATPGNAEIFKRGVRKAATFASFGALALNQAQRAQALDTHLIFHPLIPPFKIQRQGADDQWDSRSAQFDNIPKFDFDGTNIGAVDEVQELRFVDYLPGEIFGLSLEGESTTQITYQGGSPLTAAAIQAALEQLPNVLPGGVSVGHAGGDVYHVTFKSKNAGQDVGELVGQTVHSVSGGVYASTLTHGATGGEPVISSARGWPATGAFYQGRLFLGGLGSRPNTLLASRLGFHFDLNVKGLTNTKAISVDLDTDEVTTISTIFPGQHLQVFTSAAEFYFPTEPIQGAPAIKQTTRRGIAYGVPPFEMSGGTIFVTGGGEAIAEYLYDDAQQNYTAHHISKLASHICRAITDVGFRRSRSTIEHDLALFVRANGEITAMTALREEGVTGFAPWTTDGHFMACAGERVGDLYVVVRRENQSGAYLALERFDTARFLDSGARVEGEVWTIGGLGHLEGRMVTVLIDGADVGEHLVENGQVALPYKSQAWAEAGLNFEVRGKLMPTVLEDPRGGASMRPRTGNIDFRLGPTANLKAGMAGGKLWSVPLKRRPAALLNEGPSEKAFEGWTRVWGVPGFQNDAQVEFVQERPGPLSIIEIVGTVQS